MVSISEGGAAVQLRWQQSSCFCWVLHHAACSHFAGSLSMNKQQLHPLTPLIADACPLHGQTHQQTRADQPESLLRTSCGTDTVRPSNSGWESFLPLPSLTLASVSQLKRVAFSLQGAEACLFEKGPRAARLPCVLYGGRPTLHPAWRCCRMRQAIRWRQLVSPGACEAPMLLCLDISPVTQDLL